MLIVNNVIARYKTDIHLFRFNLFNYEKLCKRLTYYSCLVVLGLPRFEGYIYYFNHIDKHKHFSKKKQYIEMLNAYHK